MLVLNIVVPCFNEEAALPVTAERLRQLIARLIGEQDVSPTSCVIFVDDGSSDSTWTTIESLATHDPLFRGIRLSRNCGHQNALLCGLFSAMGDVVVSIDADLQDDTNAIGEMLRQHRNGFDIVYGVRQSREADTPFKRMSAEGYYRLLRLMKVDVVFNHADYRLMSRRAVDALRDYKEVNLFLRGVIPLLGFRATSVAYTREKRVAGESKYPLAKMLALAWQGVTSFSAVPLRLITVLGFAVSLASFVVGIWALLVRAFDPAAVPGWASTVLPIYLLGGVQLLCIGVIGEYQSKIYLETKQRPRYIIERTAEFHPDAPIREASGRDGPAHVEFGQIPERFPAAR